ncbi:unnamed protein product [Discosporangium mesarthrocarpum]
MAPSPDSGLGKDDAIVRLNVGGRRFLTSVETIMQQKNSMLASLFKGNFKRTTDAEGFAFIDRDGERFHHVLNFLRCSSLPTFDQQWRYEEIMEEADFFSIEELRQLCQQRIEELQEAKRREQEQFKSFGCRVTILESQSAGPSMQTAPERRPRLGVDVFTLDEDF